MKKTTRLKKPQVPELDKLYLFDELGGRPKYGNEEMTSETDIPSFDSIMDDTHSAVVAETSARVLADRALQNEIDTIKAASDVVDIVGTYADLQAYDTSKLNDNDIIKVLEDETHDDAVSYYRWAKASSQFNYIGSQGPYQDKLIAGSNIQIASDGKTISATDTTYTAGTNVQINGTTISATDTTYSNFVGTDGTSAGAAGLVPAPATTDAGKVLGADGTWVPNSVITTVQVPGTSTTDIMSQDATTNMVFRTRGGTSAWDPDYYHRYINIGGRSTQDTMLNGAWGVNIGGWGNPSAGSREISDCSVTIGHGVYTAGLYNVIIGSTNTYGIDTKMDSSVLIGPTVGPSGSGINIYRQSIIAIGNHATIPNQSMKGSISLGAYSKAQANGEMNIGSTETAYGYNSSNYRLLTGLYDPQSAHDAATKGYVDTAVSGATNTINSTDWNALWQ